MSPQTIDQMLDAARSQLRRLYAFELPEALERGAILVDIRPQAQRIREGTMPGALVIERNVLEWRLDPTSSARLALATDHDVEWIVLCSEGYTSSLAAASLQQLGLHRATDLVGGYQALKAAGLLTVASPAPHFAREVAALASL
ncbi:sulfurtransferase [Nocardia cyriacigeorgica]|uniref:rhodanese-like domain-containing protein n=1 Tax=Nocardia cyriacigeorgica TaxID=135487 RepID=UPI0018932FCD|nr:rhodanese-like domain-containing protein [Nocardia cyriacigeorgica]MBF6099479.1 sulfurtransferase [Nocardia cyriacigeorgica]MBF6160195.1 sulfurtransferase [Nocardia cyriacigeorgica]MBF6199279.1 sulfurtransferase [Nocardia cyriacigeorgica]MBF6319231.1 sulfurtransferase [Nocardia cyriacigeorgica]MBF6535399.1 sulfurtransferase [Nocardia cyriacigeorgica]